MLLVVSCKPSLAPYSTDSGNWRRGRQLSILRRKILLHIWSQCGPDKTTDTCTKWFNKLQLMSKETRNDSRRDQESDQRVQVKLWVLVMPRICRNRRSQYGRKIYEQVFNKLIQQKFMMENRYTMWTITRILVVYSYADDRKLNRIRRSSKKIVTSLMRFTAYSPL